MKTILAIIQKEFLQIFRNKMMLPIIFIMPIVQLVILVYAANLEMKEINMVIINKDLSDFSRKLTEKFIASPFFNISFSQSSEEANSLMKKDKADIIMNIPADFAKKLIKENLSEIQLLFNAVNGTKAAVADGYCRNIIFNFNKNIIINSSELITEHVNYKQINIIKQFWYNPQLDYKIYMSTGILVILITIVSMFLSGMNLVREKEIGTIEQINVTPIRKIYFIAGKLIPFLIIALFELAFGLIIAKFLFHLPMSGSLTLLFFVASIYLIAMLGFGLFISTVTKTQQQAMFIAFFFYLIFIMMSGIFTPAESMPIWAQKVNYINPIAWFMRVIRMILLKGSGFAQIKGEILYLSVYSISILSLAVWRYRKTG